MLTLLVMAPARALLACLALAAALAGPGAHTEGSACGWPGAVSGCSPQRWSDSVLVQLLCASSSATAASWRLTGRHT